MIRRALGAGAAMLLLLAASVAGAAAPAGPRLAVVKATRDAERIELITVDQSGASPVRLVRGGPSARPLPYPPSPISWRPDGGQIAFSGVTISSTHRERLWIFLVRPDGSGLRLVPKTAEAFWPVFSPDGHTLAFTRVLPNERVGFERAAIWTLDLRTGDTHRLTPWRDGPGYYASSFSPDGSTLLAMRENDLGNGDVELIALHLDGGDPTLLPVEGFLPVYSPDGSMIVLLRETGGSTEGLDLFVLDVTDGGLRRLTYSPSRRELFASWDPSGERIVYTRFPPADSKANGNSIGSTIMQVNADGTCQSKLLSIRKIGLYASAWQPGPGRGAGRIAC